MYLFRNRTDFSFMYISFRFPVIIIPYDDTFFAKTRRYAIKNQTKSTDIYTDISN